jgi:hypothetical protein
LGTCYPDREVGIDRKEKMEQQEVKEGKAKQLEEREDGRKNVPRKLKGHVGLT